MRIDLNTIDENDAAAVALEEEEAKKHTMMSLCLCPELWHACAGPLVSLPKKGSVVVYFPQGHLEQICADSAAGHLRFDLPPRVFCRVVDVKLQVRPSISSHCILYCMHVIPAVLFSSGFGVLQADASTDEVYAQLSILADNEVKKIFTCHLIF